jgi:methylated-DNA-protein-cysteine methyltransferase-like protein
MKETKDYYDKVYEVVAQIPQGRVTTYGIIAQHIGLKSGARMVGYALNNSIKSGHEIPAHRVVNRLGQLTGRAHFPGDTMKERLEQEGIEVDEDYTIEIDKYLWKPH